MLSPEEEMDLLSEYMTNLYAGQDWEFPSFSLHSSPIQAERITHELLHIQGRKAVPVHIVPSFTWKSLAEPIGELVAGWCAHWFRAGHIPTEWRSGWIVFLPSHPSALRPIALQTPLPKCLMSRELARQHALFRLFAYPQFAYLPGRGIMDTQGNEMDQVQDMWGVLRGVDSTSHKRQRAEHQLTRAQKLQKTFRHCSAFTTCMWARPTRNSA